MTKHMPQVFAAIGWLDWAFVGVLAISIGVGLVRGVVFELLSLAGWVVAWFVAQWVAPQVAPHLPVGTPGGGLNLGMAFALSFVAALVVWAMLARLARLLIRATPLSFVDRLLVALFGALRGVVLLLALAMVVALTPAAQSQDWRRATGARWLGQAIWALGPLLPESARQLLN